jgi:hypothetical protein
MLFLHLYNDGDGQPRYSAANPGDNCAKGFRGSIALSEPYLPDYQI